MPLAEVALGSEALTLPYSVPKRKAARAAMVRDDRFMTLALLAPVARAYRPGA